MANNQTIKLNLINQSNDANNSQVVVFQKNVAPSYEELAVAWRVIQNLGQGDNHPFNYPLDLYISANDSWGNFTPKFLVSPGDAYSMALLSSGDVLTRYAPGAGAPTDIDVRNDLLKGAIGANIYRDGKLIAAKTSVAPGQKATFLFKPTIYIGVVSEIEEGQIMDSAIMSSINTELSLLGIMSADILMTGGGPGPSSTPFQFTMTNLKYS